MSSVSFFCVFLSYYWTYNQHSFFCRFLFSPSYLSLYVSNDWHFLQELSKRSKWSWHLIRRETFSSITRSSSIRRCAPIVRSSNCFQNKFFLNQDCQLWIQVIVDSTISGISFNVSRSRAVNLNQNWRKIQVERFHSLENAGEWVLFFLRMILDGLEFVHQFKEFIRRDFSRERQRKRSYFDGKLSWPFQKRIARDSFYRLKERSRTLSI
jgi:hypothetical protein